MSTLISNIIKQWKNVKTKKRAPPPNTPHLKRIINRHPDSLEAKVAVSPYARILASPLRHCSFHRRMFPSKLLLRFGTGWHTETNMLWAFPTIGQKKLPGRGYYVNLQKRVLEVLKRGGFNAVFYGTANYRSDMTEHVENLLFKESFQQFIKHPISSYHILKPLSTSEWSSSFDNTMGYQCILLMDRQHTGKVCELGHHIYIQSSNQVQSNLPCYSVKHLWTAEQMDQVIQQFDHDHIALGIPKSLKTVDLAVTLWRCRKFLV
ncbi:hypothetical protein G6F46_005440 [Rhizopus delemar]|nr:hypothetical protein G6F55_010128 [Rhizopus delemar]KAG1536585.1 hypothetical protein G6F51_010887 [Rhizopus arrhizus]KAG1498933.1 hypothetical protein G6F54_004740 [Rhizopus delemar]KAG1503563.1 hypothetical protein G6F53_010601 [Rhizopus delemar]KAG1519982.1 hypothetical protein G6F52_008098 [Rhizopus delemar]